MKNTIFIRVDSSTKIGYGHFIRCMALADTLQKNFKINFISRSLEGSLISDIQDKRFGIFRFYSNSEKINEKHNFHSSRFQYQNRLWSFYAMYGISRYSTEKF